MGSWCFQGAGSSLNPPELQGEASRCGETPNPKPSLQTEKGLNKKDKP